MGTITERRRKDGTPSYLAQIVIKHGGTIIRRENKTFADIRKARAWIAIREADRSADVDDPPLADVIDRYTSTSRKSLGRTKLQVLAAIKRDQIGRLKCSRIGSKDLIAYAERLGSSRKPQTVANYLSHLAAVFAVAKPAWGYPLERQAMLDAFMVAKRLGVTSKSRERDRRPTDAELAKLDAHFARIRARRCDSIPMVDIMWFAMHSTRRQEEITRIEWRDFEPEHRRVMVRDMKHPGDKEGNDQWCDLPPEAVAIIERQPRRSDRIFPCSTDAVSAAFTRACKVLGIVDLHFHDLRHEGVSRLFELGWSIPQVACVSGHRSWKSLQRYAHIKKKPTG